MKDFSNVMSERTDMQLVEIVTVKRNEYQPEAITAAENELKQRDIEEDQYLSYNLVSEVQNTIEPLKSELSFKWQHKLLTVLLLPAIIAAVNFLFHLLKQPMIIRSVGFPVIVIICYLIHDRLKYNGYTQMEKDFLKWITYSLFIYCGLFLVIGLGVYLFAM